MAALVGFGAPVEAKPKSATCALSCTGFQFQPFFVATLLGSESCGYVCGWFAPIECYTFGTDWNSWWTSLVTSPASTLPPLHKDAKALIMLQRNLRVLYKTSPFYTKPASQETGTPEISQI